MEERPVVAERRFPWCQNGRFRLEGESIELTRRLTENTLSKCQADNETRMEAVESSIRGYETERKF